MNKSDELLKMKQLLDDGVLTEEEFLTEKRRLLGTSQLEEKTTEKAVLKKKKKKTIPVFFLVLIILIVGLPKIVKKIDDSIRESEVPIFFNPHWLEVAEGDGSRTMTDVEIIEKLGSPTSSEEWKFETLGGAKLPLKTLTYQNQSDYSYREYVFIKNKEGAYSLLRVNIYEDVEISKTSDIFKKFNLKRQSNSIIKDLGVSFRAKNAGVYDFWIPSIKNGVAQIIKITYFEVLGFSD